MVTKCFLKSSCYKNSLNNMKHGTFYNEDIDRDDRNIKLQFCVECNSPISMQEGDTVDERIKSLIKQCEDAMGSDMDHWGDFHYDIECVKATIEDWDNNKKLIAENIDIDKLYGF